MILHFQKSFPFTIIFHASLLTFHPSLSQTSAPPGIFADSVYHSVKLTSDIVYGSNFNPFYNEEDTLKLDIYEPDSIIDYLRPVLIYVHGGGFTGGDKTTDKAAIFGNHFAKCGYLYASINYRLYIDDGSDTIDNFQGVYMCTQDAKSAVRFFRKHAIEYCVDTSMILMIGTSAGGAICLNSAYWDQSEADSIFNTSSLVPLKTAVATKDIPRNLRQLFPPGGGMTDTSWLQNETTPNQLFHGTEDTIVPYVWGLAANGVYLFGGYTIHEASLLNNIESHLHSFIGAGHGVPSSSPQFDTIVQVSAEFLFNHLNAGEGSVPCSFTTLSGEEKSNNLISVSTLNDHHLLIGNNQEQPFSGLLKIYSAGGILMKCSEIIIPSGSKIEINCQSLTPGFYLCQIQSGNLIHAARFLVAE